MSRRAAAGDSTVPLGGHLTQGEPSPIWWPARVSRSGIEEPRRSKASLGTGNCTRSIDDRVCVHGNRQHDAVHGPTIRIPQWLTEAAERNPSNQASAKPTNATLAIQNGPICAALSANSSHLRPVHNGIGSRVLAVTSDRDAALPLLESVSDLTCRLLICCRVGSGIIDGVQIRLICAGGVIIALLPR
jgi:hypothetical protein